ncbi:unnamed protein product [Amoebophrya sp. A25]|nr:unnamed protein product [Amoebophrya sp. A25]|eukprot:GSA25T00023791001.1
MMTKLRRVWRIPFLVIAAQMVEAEKYRDGASGIRCQICKELARSALGMYREKMNSGPAKAVAAATGETSKDGNKKGGSVSANIQIPTSKASLGNKDNFLARLQKHVCQQNNLSHLPNPKGYALHLPTLKYDCEDLVENLGMDLIDALTLSEDVVKDFCADQDECPAEDSDDEM